SWLPGWWVRASGTRVVSSAYDDGCRDRRGRELVVGALWHGFADMGAIERDGAFVVSRGEGAYIWDDAGNRYLDATAGLWVTNVGHGRTEIGEAIAAQVGKRAHYSNCGDLTPEPAVEL